MFVYMFSHYRPPTSFAHIAILEHWFLADVMELCITATLTNIITRSIRIYNIMITLQNAHTITYQ